MSPVAGGFRGGLGYAPGGAAVPSGPGVFTLSWSRSPSNLAQVHAASHGAQPLADATQSIAAAQVSLRRKPRNLARPASHSTVTDFARHRACSSGRRFAP